MSRLRPVWAWVLLLGFASAAPAANDPLQLIPPDADLILKIDNPRLLVETLLKIDPVREGQAITTIQEVLQSTTAKKLYQLLHYAEKEMGSDWPTILDTAAGNGIVLAVSYGDYQGAFPAAMVIQGKDAAANRKLGELAIKMLEEELARQNPEAITQRKKHRGAWVTKFSDELMIALADNAIVVATNAKALDRVLALQEQPGANITESKDVAAGRELLGGKPLAWLWYNFAPVKEFNGLKGALEQPRNDLLQTVFFSGLLDVMKRTQYITAGLFATPEGMKLSVRTPAGLIGRADETLLHVPPDGESGSLPLLEPKGVLFSHSFYMDFGALWNKRKDILNEANRQGLEEGDKAGSRFLPGGSLSKLLQQSGPHHRFVAVAHRPTSYKIQPKQQLPGFAFVTTMRDPQFARSVETLVRTGVFLASTQLGLKLNTFEHQGLKVVSYKFPEDKVLVDDVDNLRFNFTPCFVKVGEQMVFCSTQELCREMIDLVQKEGTAPASTSNMKMRFYADGSASFLESVPDQILTQNVLDQAIPFAEAEAQAKKLLSWIKSLGWVGIRYDFQPSRFELAFEWSFQQS